MINRINSELANDFGNLVQRVLAMVYKYHSGIIPKSLHPNKEDTSMQQQAEIVFKTINNDMNNYQFNMILEKYMENN